MFYKIQVYEDGDVYVTKVPTQDPCGQFLYFEDLESLRRELIEYEVRCVDEDIKDIKAAEMFEEVRCYWIGNTANFWNLQGKKPYRNIAPSPGA